MTQLVNALSDELESVVKWIEANYVDLNIPSDGENVQIAAECFDIAMEHQSGVLLLCKA